MPPPILTWEDALEASRLRHVRAEGAGHNVLVFQCASSPSFKEHRHTYFEIIYVLSGHCTQQLNGHTLSMQEGDISILPPPMSHSLYFTGDDQIISILIRKNAFTDIFPTLLQGQDTISDFFIDSLYNDNSENYLLFHTGAQRGAVQRHILDMLAEAQNADSFSDRILTSMLMTFLMKILRTYPNEAPPMPDKDRRDEILSLIYHNYSTITLSGLAEYLHYTVPYCSRYLKAHLGCTFSQLLKEIRFQKAEGMLANSGMTVGQISKELGYENPENFIRAFKQHYSLTPTQYRVMHAHPVEA